MADPLVMDWKKENLPQELLELRDLIQAMPLSVRDKLLPLCDRVCHFTRLQSRLVKIAQDAVDQLTMDIKYLNFDLEATRRERDAFRQELEEQSEGF